MGSLLGHIVPGTFFSLFALWWSFCLAAKHYHSHQRRRSSRQVYLARSTTTFPCICCPSAERIPWESYLKIVCVSVGMLGELVTGFSHAYDEKSRRQAWTLSENNAQHVTMFFAFGLASLVEVLVARQYQLPDGIEFLANILAFGVEAFLFHFHLHGRDPIDIHVHTLLVYAIAFCMLAAIWEYNRPEQILATYARIAATLLQGVWFLVIAFILYFPSSDPYWIWSSSHGHILLITAIFVWIGLCICLFLLVQSMLVWCLLKHRNSLMDGYSIVQSQEDIDESVIVRTARPTDTDHLELH